MARMTAREIEEADKAGLIWRCPTCTQMYKVGTPGEVSRCLICNPYTPEDLSKQILEQGRAYGGTTGLGTGHQLPSPPPSALSPAPSPLVSIEQLFSTAATDPMKEQTLNVAIRQFRLLCDLTQRGLSTLLQVDQVTIHRAERGKHEPSPRLLLVLARLAIAKRMELFARKFIYHAMARK